MEKIHYLSKGGKRFNIRASAGDKLKHFTVPQGACSDGKYIYVVFERKKPHACKIVKIRMSDLKIVKVSKPLHVGHGNDITYHNGCLYITYSKGKSIVSVVNAKSLKKSGTVSPATKSKHYYNAICRLVNGFMLRVMGGKNLLKISGGFANPKWYKTKNSYTTSQGMDFNGKYLVRAYSKLQSKDKNYIVRYNIKGKQLKRTRLKLTGEFESVFFVNNTLYGVVYRKRKVNGKKTYKAFIFRIPKY